VIFNESNHEHMSSDEIYRKNKRLIRHEGGKGKTGVIE